MPIIPVSGFSIASNNVDDEEFNYFKEYQTALKIFNHFFILVPSITQQPPDLRAMELYCLIMQVTSDNLQISEDIQNQTARIKARSAGTRHTISKITMEAIQRYAVLQGGQNSVHLCALFALLFKIRELASTPGYSKKEYTLSNKVCQELVKAFARIASEFEEIAKEAGYRTWSEYSTPFLLFDSQILEWRCLPTGQFAPHTSDKTLYLPNRSTTKDQCGREISLNGTNLSENMIERRRKAVQSYTDVMKHCAPNWSELLDIEDDTFPVTIKKFLDSTRTESNPDNPEALSPPDNWPSMQSLPPHISADFILALRVKPESIDAQMKLAPHLWINEDHQKELKRLEEFLLVSDLRHNNLFVAQSGIPNSGEGLFAARDMRKGQTACFFMGAIAYHNLRSQETCEIYGTPHLHFDINSWVQDAMFLMPVPADIARLNGQGLHIDCIRNLCIVPMKYCAGRFANDPRIFEDGLPTTRMHPNCQANCEAVMSAGMNLSRANLMKPNLIRIQLTRDVKAGDELFMDYGPSYNLILSNIDLRGSRMQVRRGNYNKGGSAYGTDRKRRKLGSSSNSPSSGSKNSKRSADSGKSRKARFPLTELESRVNVELGGAIQISGTCTGPGFPRKPTRTQRRVLLDIAEKLLPKP